MRSWLLHHDGPVHVADFGGTGPAIFLLHGLGGSHADWVAVSECLTRTGRVLCPDLPGFGRTSLAGRSSSVASNARIVSHLLDRIGDGPIVLAGNSMGATIALHVSALRPQRVAMLVLMAPWLPRGEPERTTAAAQAPAGSLAVRRSVLRTWAGRDPVTALRQMINLGCAQPDRVPAAVLAATMQVACERARLPAEEDGFVPAVTSLIESARRPHELLSVVQQITAPTLLIHGSEDRVVPPAAVDRLRQLRPDWASQVLTGVGHTPQLEAPGEVARLISEWIVRQGGARCPAPQRLAARAE